MTMFSSRIVSYIWGILDEAYFKKLLEEVDLVHLVERFESLQKPFDGNWFSFFQCCLHHAGEERYWLENDMEVNVSMYLLQIMVFSCFAFLFRRSNLGVLLCPRASYNDLVLRVYSITNQSLHFLTNVQVL